MIRHLALHRTHLDRVREPKCQVGRLCVCKSPQWVPAVGGAVPRMSLDDHLQFCLPNLLTLCRSSAFISLVEIAQWSTVIRHLYWSLVCQAPFKGGRIGIWTNSLCSMLASIVIPYL